MRKQPAGYWIRLTSGLWFLPAAIVTFLILLAMAAVTLDAHLGASAQQYLPGLMTADADSARDLLSSISSSMVTVAGVVFSITIVAFALASSMYSSRVLRGFMRDRVNQVVLGSLSGTFAYCVTVLLSITGAEGAFVPSIAVFIGFLLSLAGVFALIYFIHNVAIGIQASSVIALIATDTLESIEDVFTTARSQNAPAGEEPVESGQRRWREVPARRTGYIEYVNIEKLLALAQKGMVVRMDRAAGDFVITGKPLISVLLDRQPSRREIRELNRAHHIGRNRTVDQDPDFGIRQLTDVAIKALSPGVNDTTTAVIAVDYLGAVLVSAAARFERKEARLPDGRLGVIIRGPTFEGMLSKSFDQIRQNANGNIAVMTALLNALQTLATCELLDCRRDSLARQIRSLAELVERSIDSPYDRQEVEAHVLEVAKQIGLPEDTFAELAGKGKGAPG